MDPVGRGRSGRDLRFSREMWPRFPSGWVRPPGCSFISQEALRPAVRPKSYRAVFPCTKWEHILPAKQRAPTKLLLELAAPPKPCRVVLPCTKWGHTRLI